MGSFNLGMLIGRLCWFTVIGAMAVLLIGPVMGLLGAALGLVAALLSLVLAAIVVVAPFAALGFLLWLPIRLLQRERPRQGPTPPSYQHQQQQQRPQFDAVPQRIAVPSAQPCRGVGRKVSGIVLEAICGAIILGTLAALISTDLGHRQREAYILGGSFIGAVLGFVVGLANHVPERESLCRTASSR